MIKKNLAIVPAFAWLFVCTFLLTLPGSSIPKENWLDKIGADKLVHIGLFAVMVFLYCRYFYKTQISVNGKKRWFIVVTLFVIIYGIAMEFVQKHMVSNRSFDSWDIVADTGGAVLGYIVSYKRYIKNKPL